MSLLFIQPVKLLPHHSAWELSVYWVYQNFAPKILLGGSLVLASLSISLLWEATIGHLMNKRYRAFAVTRSLKTGAFIWTFCFCFCCSGNILMSDLWNTYRQQLKRRIKGRWLLPCFQAVERDMWAQISSPWRERNVLKWPSKAQPAWNFRLYHRCICHRKVFCIFP